MSKPHGHSIDDYLEAIHFLVSPIGVYEPAKAPAAARRVLLDSMLATMTSWAVKVARIGILFARTEPGPALDELMRATLRGELYSVLG